MIMEGPSFAVMGAGVTKDDAEAAPVVRSVAKASPAIVRVNKNCPAQLTRPIRIEADACRHLAKTTSILVINESVPAALASGEWQA
jgi:hypothetical protein